MKISFYAEVEIPVDERFSRTISTTVTLEGEAIIELSKAISAAQQSVQPTVLNGSEKDVVCPMCSFVFDVPANTHSG